MLTLLTVTTLMPVVKAPTYRWDGVWFVHDIYVKYPHPDRDYYEISPYSEWSIKGGKLYHKQIDYATSKALTLTAPVIGAVFGAIIGAQIGHPVIGGVVGTVLGVVLTWVADVYFLDECGCIWWWISVSFVDWLSANAADLLLLYLRDPSLAQAQIMYAFLGCGYLRAGSVTFYDAIHRREPIPPHDVAVTNVSPVFPSEYYTEVYASWQVPIEVTVENKGCWTETFDVHCWYNGTDIGTETVTLIAEATTTLTFIWDTTGVTPDTYTIGSMADYVTGETEKWDNIRSCTLKVKKLGDVDGNGWVNVIDIQLCCINMGPVPPSPPECDVNGDGTVNILDINTVAANMG